MMDFHDPNVDATNACSDINGSFLCLQHNLAGRSAALVVGGRVPGDGSKIMNEMGLVEVAEFEGEIGPVQRLPGFEPIDQLVQSISLDDPLGRNPNIFA